jgi:hypothetical protein
VRNGPVVILQRRNPSPSHAFDGTAQGFSLIIDIEYFIIPGGVCHDYHGCPYKKTSGDAGEEHQFNVMS